MNNRIIFAAIVTIFMIGLSIAPTGALAQSATERPALREEIERSIGVLGNGFLGKDMDSTSARDWALDVKNYNDPLCIIWSNGRDQCERDIKTGDITCRTDENRIISHYVQCTKPNFKLLKTFCLTPLIPRAMPCRKGEACRRGLLPPAPLTSLVSCLQYKKDRS